MKYRPVLLTLLVVILWATNAFALEMEYYTYNGIDAVSSAFQKIALIFSDRNYHTLYYVIITVSIMIGIMMSYIKGLAGMKGNMVALLVPIAVGVAIYQGFVVHTGTLHIYDPVKNKTVDQGGIPDGVVFIAGVANKMERGLVQMVETSGDPLGYQSQAGGFGFNGLLGLSQTGVQVLDQYVYLSLAKYTEDCVVFAVGTGDISVNELANNNDFMVVYQKAKNQAVYTTWYSSAPGGQGGTVLTCSDAYEQLKSDLGASAGDLSSANPFAPSLRSRCGEVGFDPESPTEMQACIDATRNFYQAFLNTGISDVTTLHRQTLLAQSLNDVLLKASPDQALSVLANRNTGTSMMGMGSMANQWIPIIRAVVTALAIGMIPFLALFIPTPFFGRACSIVAGFFIWIAVWGVADAVLHQFAMDYARKCFDVVRANNLGLTAIMNFSSSSMKTLAAFGAIRWAGIMMASVITGMLVKFGGHALAMFAGQITAAQQQGAHAASSTVTPEGMGSSIGSYSGAVATIANAGKFEFMQRTGAQENIMAASHGRGVGMDNQDRAFAVGELGGKMETRGAEVKQAMLQHYRKEHPGATEDEALKSMTGSGQAFVDPNTGLTYTMASNGSITRVTGVNQMNKLGPYMPEVRDTVQQKYGEALVDAQKTTESARGGATESVQAVKGKGRDFVKAVNESKGFQKDQRETLNEGISSSERQTTGVAEELSRAAGVDINTARQYVSATQAQIGAQLKWEPSETAVGKIGKLLSGASAGVEAGLKKTGVVQDQEALSRMTKHMTTDRAHRAYEAGLTEHRSIEAARATASKQGIDSVTRAGDAYQAKLDEAHGKTMEYSQSQAREQALRETIEYSETKGLMTRESLNEPVWQYMKNKYGEAGAVQLLQGSDLDSKKAVKDALDHVSDSYIGGIKQTAAFLAERKDAFSKLMDTNIVAAQERTNIEPKAYYKDVEGQIIRMQKAGGVGPGTVIPLAKGVVSEGDRKRMQEQYNVKVKEMTPTQMINERQELEKKFDGDYKSFQLPSTIAQVVNKKDFDTSPKIQGAVVGVVEKVPEAANKLLNLAKEAPTGIVKAATPFPLLSPEEQQKRLEEPKKYAEEHILGKPGEGPVGQALGFKPSEKPPEKPDPAVEAAKASWVAGPGQAGGKGTTTDAGSQQEAPGQGHEDHGTGNRVEAAPAFKTDRFGAEPEGGAGDAVNLRGVNETTPATTGGRSGVEERDGKVYGEQRGEEPQKEDSVGPGGTGSTMEGTRNSGAREEREGRVDQERSPAVREEPKTGRAQMSAEPAARESQQLLPVEKEGRNTQAVENQETRNRPAGERESTKGNSEYAARTGEKRPVETETLPSRSMGVVSTEPDRTGQRFQENPSKGMEQGEAVERTMSTGPENTGRPEAYRGQERSRQMREENIAKDAVSNETRTTPDIPRLQGAASSSHDNESIFRALEEKYGNQDATKIVRGVEAGNSYAADMAKGVAAEMDGKSEPKDVGTVNEHREPGSTQRNAGEDTRREEVKNTVGSKVEEQPVRDEKVRGEKMEPKATEEESPQQYRAVEQEGSGEAARLFPDRGGEKQSSAAENIYAETLRQEREGVQRESGVSGGATERDGVERPKPPKSFGGRGGR